MAIVMVSLRLTRSARDVLAHVVRSGEVTRPMLCAELGLSRPTASAAVAELEGHDLIDEIDIRQGATGRSASVYALSPRSGHVLGLDAGSTAVRVVAARLDGSAIVERAEARVTPGRLSAWTESALACRLVAEAAEELGGAHGPLRAVRVATPTAVYPDGTTMEGADGWREFVARLETSLRAAGPVPVHLINNVNCSAWAEYTAGAAHDAETWVFLQVGVNLGGGIVHRGNMIAGANGVAGEISFLPYPWRAGAAYEPEALEERIGANGWLERVRRGWPDDDPPASTVELFAAAERGVLHARRVVRKHGAEIGRVAAVVAAVVDPDVIVLGGGIGQHPMIVDAVRSYLSQLPWPVRVAPTKLRASATALGAARLAAAEAMRELLGGA
ncbi:MAG: ROK family protein [Actinomycetia bacterium]|nr:ROK family protein [Actinomycetes bacterium]